MEQHVPYLNSKKFSRSIMRDKQFSENKIENELDKQISNSFDKIV